MKTLVTVILVMFCACSLAQDTTSFGSTVSNSQIEAFFAPINSFCFSNDSMELILTFKYDSLIASGDMALDEAAKMFIEYCRQYIYTKIDSLEMELKKCKDEIEPEPNYVMKFIELNRQDSTMRIDTNLLRHWTIDADNLSMKIDGPIMITDKMLFQYERDCYNDSTVFHEQIFQIGSYVRDTTFYTHKQPDNLADFIKWLRKN
ncbi:hypothetical protein KKH23_07085 [Patescibacteria group bacterium]|uniref:Uncharacterized protein n=1 Tax=viral metagenome TaxID=1070528 RepID=A0A6M3M185_9ZZZZ|nr:hypothetical protein [Patescibacteria group bacterium]